MPILFFKSPNYEHLSVQLSLHACLLFSANFLFKRLISTFDMIFIILETCLIVSLEALHSVTPLLQLYLSCNVLCDPPIKIRLQTQPRPQRDKLRDKLQETLQGVTPLLVQLQQSRFSCCDTNCTKNSYQYNTAFNSLNYKQTETPVPFFLVKPKFLTVLPCLHVTIACEILI